MPAVPSTVSEFFPTKNATYALHVFPSLIRAPRAIVFVTVLQDAELPGEAWRVERWTERGWVSNGLTWGASDIVDSFGGTGHGPDTGPFEYYAAYEPYKAGDEVALLFDMRGQLPGDRVRLSHSGVGFSGVIQHGSKRYESPTRPLICQTPEASVFPDGTVATRIDSPGANKVPVRHCNDLPSTGVFEVSTGEVTVGYVRRSLARGPEVAKTRAPGTTLGWRPYGRPRW